MSDTPYPTDPHEGDSFDPMGSGPSGANGSDSLSPEGANAFFGGAAFEYDGDDGFEPAIEAGSFASGADAYFEDATLGTESTEAPPAPSGDGASEDADALIAAPKPRRRGKNRAPKPSRSRASQLVLGVHVTPTRVHGLLIRDEGDGRYSAVMQLTRTRSTGPEDTSGAMTPSDVGVMDIGESFADGEVQFGAGQELDFTGEFDGIAGGDTGIDMGAIGNAPRAVAQPIVFELRDMLEEIARAGHETAALAFGVTPPDVEYAEIIVPADKKKAKKNKKRKNEDPSSENVKRDKLVQLLPDAEPGREVNRDLVQFVPMTSREGRPRFLALIPQPTEPVTPALGMLREQRKHRRTSFRTIESEVSLLMGMAGLVCPAEPHENTAVVRVGIEETLVLLLSGNELHHMEPMQSVTAYDGPDTICSRVLLQQDVQGVGTVHNVIVLSDEREEELVQGFAAFYPDARVASLGALLTDFGLRAGGSETDPEPLPAESIEAAGAALAASVGKGSPFADANLLPKALRKKRSRVDLSFSWHTLVVSVLLFLSVVYFMGVYLTQSSDIADRERQLAEYPVEATMATPQLQARIDSLRMAQAEITAALGAMDSLLYGTDRWTQDLVRTSQAASASGGVWFEDWQPGENAVSLHGYATSRARVVSLAQRLNATVEEVTYGFVRDYPVYEFRMTSQSPLELPQTSRYLREQMGDAVPPPRDALGLDAPAPGVAPAPAPPADS